MTDITGIEVQSEDASFLYGRVVDSTEVLRLVSIWAELTGRSTLDGVRSLEEAALRVGVDEFRQFILHASGGFARMLELHNGGHDLGEGMDESSSLFEALKPPSGYSYAVFWPDFSDPYLQTKVDRANEEGGWKEELAPRIAEEWGDEWLIDTVRNGGWTGVKRQLHLSEAVAERMTTDIVIWYRFRCKRVHNFTVDLSSDLAEGIAKGDSPSVVTFRSKLVGPDSVFLLGLHVDGQLQTCGDVLGPWTSDEEYGPCEWGWSNNRHYFEDDIFCER